MSSEQSLDRYKHENETVVIEVGVKTHGNYLMNVIPRRFASEISTNSLLHTLSAPLNNSHYEPK